AVALMPSSGEAHRDLGLALRKLDRLDEAIAELRRAAELLPADPRTRIMLGQMLERAGASEEAARQLAAGRKGTERQRNRELAKTYNNQGTELLQRGELDAAAAKLKQAIDLNPQDPLAHYNYGLASLLSGKLDQAIAHFESAVQLAPADPDTHYYLGRARLLRKEYAAAVAELQSAVKLNPADARAYNALGVALAANGKPDAAKDALEKALELDPSSPLFRKNTQCLREGCALEP